MKFKKSLLEFVGQRQKERKTKLRSELSERQIKQEQDIVNLLKYNIKIKPSSEHFQSLGSAKLNFVSYVPDPDDANKGLVIVKDANDTLDKTHSLPIQDMEFVFPMDHFILNSNLGLCVYFEIINYNPKIVQSQSYAYIQSFSDLPNQVLSKIFSSELHEVLSVTRAIEAHSILFAMPELRIYKIDFSSTAAFEYFYKNTKLNLTLD